jgi:hypothetical protein
MISQEEFFLGENFLSSPSSGCRTSSYSPCKIIINDKVNKDVANWPKYRLLNSNEANKET